MTATTAPAFTALEIKVLTALFESAKGNGHDFGLTEDARKAVKSARQLSGAIASLAKKGVITVHEPMNPGKGTVTQFTWNHEPETIAAFLAPKATKEEQARAKASTVAQEMAAEHGVTIETKPTPVAAKKVTVTAHQAEALREALAQATVAGVRLEGRVLFIDSCPETKKARKALFTGILAVLEKTFPANRDTLVANLETQLVEKSGAKAHWHASLHVNNLVRSAQAAALLLRARLGI